MQSASWRGMRNDEEMASFRLILGPAWSLLMQPEYHSRSSARCSSILGFWGSLYNILVSDLWVFANLETYSISKSPIVSGTSGILKSDRLALRWEMFMAATRKFVSMRLVFTSFCALRRKPSRRTQGLDADRSIVLSFFLLNIDRNWVRVSGQSLNLSSI